MKKINYIIAVVISTVLIFSQLGCSDETFDVENINAPDTKRALAQAEDVENLLVGAFRDFFRTSSGFSAIFPNLLADQTSTTNAYQAFWDYSKEKDGKIAIYNHPTNQNPGAYTIPFADFNANIQTVNSILGLIAGGTSYEISEEDVTDKFKAICLATRGLSLGTLGCLYDKGYVATEGSNLETLELKPYGELIGQAIKDIDEAIMVINSLGNEVTFELHSSIDLNSETLIELLNSFAAKFLLSEARTSQEASGLDYTKIIAYAKNGITSDFKPDALEDVFFSNLQDWSTYTLADGAGYLPTDIKIPHLMDSSGTYPDTYPTDSNIILDPVESDDARISYFGYASAFGYLRESRGRWLFTNYKNNRFYSDNNRNQSGIPVNIFHKAELDYILAEAYLMTNQLSEAKNLLDNSPRVTVGGLPPVDLTESAIRHAIFYEYSVELDLASTIGTQWFFMRRYDLLQQGTPLHYPVPATELELTGVDFYSFGGSSAEGTASGANSWR